MQENNTAENYRQFIKQVIDTQIVWGLATSEGFVSMPSVEYEDTNLMPYWSTKAYAEAMLQNGESKLEPRSIVLPEFLENWMIGLYNNNSLVCTDSIPNSLTQEHEPLQVALDIAERLITEGKNLALTKYATLQDFKSQVEKAINVD